MLVAILRFAQYNLAAFWFIFGNICKNEGCCGPFSLKLSGVRVEFSHVLIPLHRPWHLSHSNRLELSLRFCLPFYCFLFLWHLLILLALNPPSCSLPDDIGGPQPGPFLVSVMGASLQSLPLPLPPPPPLHATIQHSLSLNGKTWVQWRGRCVCVSGCLSSSESRFLPPLPLFWRPAQFLPSEAPLFYSLNVKRSRIKCECNCGILVNGKGKDNTCHPPHVSFCLTKALVDRVVSFFCSCRSEKKSGVTNVRL